MPHAEPKCPECAGKMWNQTKSKFWDETKNRPMWKCQDKECKGALWKDDKKWGLEGSELKGTVTKTEAGPGKDESQETRDNIPPTGNGAPAVSPSDVADYLGLLEQIGSGWAKVAEGWPEYMLPRAADVQAVAATLTISASRRGGR